MMDDRVRVALRDLVAEQGESILASRERLRGLLSDDCPECSREINVLMIAMQAQVPAELRTYGSATEIRVGLGAIIHRLERAFGLGRPAAAWAVLSIAYAVGRIVEQQFQTMLPELSLESGMSPPPSPPATPATESVRPLPPPPPAPPLPRPISQPASQPPPRPISQPPFQQPQPQPPPRAPYSPPMPTPVYGSPAYFNRQAPMLPAQPVIPVQPPRSSGGKMGVGIGIGIGIGVLLIVGILLAVSHRSQDQPSQGDTQTTTTPGQGPGTQSTPPGTQPPQAPQSEYITYSDASMVFQMEVPREWLSKREESDTKIDNTDSHLIRAAVYPSDAQHADLDGWISAGIRVSILTPPPGQSWQTDWATEWQKKSFNNLLNGYAKFQDTNIEPIQLGNIATSTTAVLGESPTISEPEVARAYIGFTQKYLITVEVSMPQSKRSLFDSADERLRKTFEIDKKVP